MDFDLSEEQSLLRDLIVRFATDRYDPAKRLAYVRQPNGYDPTGWAMLAETGVLAFPFSDAMGGFGGGSVELITVMEALGRAVAVEPVLPAIVIAGGVIERAGTEAQRAALLPPLIAGTALVALAHAERRGRFSQTAIAARATANGSGVRITGAKQMVLGGPFAATLIVSARDDGGNTGLYVIAADAEGVQRRDYRLADGSTASDVDFSKTPADPMAGGQAALDAVLTDARLAICAELVGLMSMMFDATLDYLKTRNQFGQAIGQFQVIQHRMADHYVRLELSRSQLYRAAAQRDDVAITGAKAYIAAQAIVLAEDAVQLHGGIGTTEELMVGQAFKRVMVLASLFGDPDWEVRRYVAMTAGTG